MKAATQLIQSTFDFAMREINALEGKIAHAEDDADDMLWEQARQVVAQLDADLSLRKLAAQWINARTGEPYNHTHVHFVAQVFSKLNTANPRPRFRDAYNALANAKSVHHSSESVEHYTPQEVIELVVAVLGEIDLDPCSNPDHPNVPAKQHFSEKDNGLAHAWAGRVYMNPPYGRDIGQWVEKLCASHEEGAVSEAIALVPARTDTQWFARFRDYVCCFVSGRLTFIGNAEAAPFPSAIVYLGNDLGKFYEHFHSVGDLWQRVQRGVHFGE